MEHVELDSGIALYSAAQIRKIELSHAEESGTGTYPLMEAAGRAAFQQIPKKWPTARKLLILTGKGNNGGDGFVLARLAVEKRYKVTLINFCPVEQIKGDALIAYQRLPRGVIHQPDWQSTEPDDQDLIIDAMLGTGIKGALRAPYAQVVADINQSKTPVLAIDVPSGLEADTGNATGDAIKAALTVTFIGHKRGLYTGESANYRGQVILCDLGISTACYKANQSLIKAHDWHSLRIKLRPRDLASHKGDHGHCLLIGGSEGMAGAAILAAKAAARSGSGLVSAWTEKAASVLVGAQPEIMARNVAPPSAGESFNAPELTRVLLKSNCLIAGPGLGRSDFANNWLAFIRQNPECQDKIKVFDADALNWLAQNPNQDHCRVVTPHPGEAARLLDTSTEKINQDRFEAAKRIAVQYGGICVLKGAGTIVCDATGNMTVCPVGNPGMASGGMGDVLAGIIGALIAQGYSLYEAAELGVCVHGEAADRVAGRRRRYRGMLASDLFAHLSELLNR